MWLSLFVNRIYMPQYRYETVEKLHDGLKEVWKGLWDASEDKNFFNSPIFFEAAIEAYKVRKYVIVLGYEEEALVAVLPLVYDRIFGIKALAGPGRARNHLDTSVMLLGKKDEDLSRSLVERALEYAPVYLAEVSEDAARLLNRADFSFFVEYSSRCLWLDVCKEENILAQMSSKERRKLLSRIRKHASSLDFVFSTDRSAHQGVSLEEVVSIERASHKPKRGMALFRHRDIRTLLQRVATAPEACLGVGVLFFEGQPAAHFLGFVSGKTFAMYHTAYVERWASLGIGKMATYFLLRHLYRAGFEKADLMRGDTPAKRQFASEYREQYTFYCARQRYVLVWWRLAKAMRDRLKLVKDWLYTLIIR